MVSSGLPIGYWSLEFMSLKMVANERLRGRERERERESQVVEGRRRVKKVSLE